MKKEQNLCAELQMTTRDKQLQPIPTVIPTTFKKQWNDECNTFN